MKPSDSIDFHIRWLWHYIARMYNNEAQKHDLTMSVGFILLNIDKKKGTPSTKLGPQMGMETGSLSRTLKNMENQGLICRKSDLSDKRVVRIFLTDLGKEKRKISKKTVLKFNQMLRDTIDEEKMNTFLEVMKEMNTFLKNEETIF